ncbi:MAG: hypothetical protein ABI205_04565, partial [Gemmatimonadaceae bacterium]
TVHHQFSWKRATLLATLFAAFAVLAPTTAHAQAPTSVHTAADHAGYAAKAADLATMKKHMHHALNCLQGKSGKDYDAAAGDPCKGVGTTYAAGSASEIKVQEAIRLLVVGETLDDMKAAQHVAQAVQEVLEEVTN